eukprot:1189281-Prorocentrum_minimum.AAC.2
MHPAPNKARTAIVWTLRATVWTLRAIMWTLRATLWTLRAIVWTLRAILWILRATVWTLRAVVWTLSPTQPAASRSINQEQEETLVTTSTRNADIMLFAPRARTYCILDMHPTYNWPPEIRFVNREIMYGTLLTPGHVT